MLKRLLGVGVLLGGYVFLWRPLRSLFMEHVASPVLGVLLGKTGVAVHASGDPRMLFLVADASVSTSIRAPGGILFLLPALILVAVFPRRLYWVYLLLINVGLRFLEWGFRIGGVAYWMGALPVADYLAGYAVPAVCIGLPILLIGQASALTPTN